LSISGTICHTWGGWAHRPRSSPVHGSSILVLDPLGRSESVLLRDCLDALSCWSSAAFCCCSGPALVWTAGRSRRAVLISSYRNTIDLSDLVMMIHMMSAKYAFSLSLVVSLDSASDASHWVCSRARGWTCRARGHRLTLRGHIRRPADWWLGIDEVMLWN
jgi:hypothetical protein